MMGTIVIPSLAKSLCSLLIFLEALSFKASYFVKQQIHPASFSTFSLWVAHSLETLGIGRCHLSPVSCKCETSQSCLIGLQVWKIISETVRDMSCHTVELYRMKHS